MEMNIGIAIYRKEDYQEIKRLSVDRNEMDRTWEIWSESKKKAVINFKQMVMKTVDVLITPRALVRYCREKAITIDGKARSEYVSYFLNKQS